MKWSPCSPGATRSWVDTSIALAGSYRLQSGYNYAREINVSLPGAGSENIPAEPLENDRAPDVGILDFRVEKTFSLGGRAGRVTGVVDVFNALNSGVVTNFRVRSGARFREVIALLDPRVVRFGVRYTF